MSIHKHGETKNMGTVMGVSILITNVIKHRNYRNYGDRNLSLALGNAVIMLTAAVGVGWAPRGLWT